MSLPNWSRIWSDELLQTDLLGDFHPAMIRMKEPEPTMTTTEAERFRTFAEQYVLQRASTFGNDNPRKEAWNTVADAVSIYKQITGTAVEKFSPITEGAATQPPANIPANLPAKLRETYLKLREPWPTTR